MLTAVLLGIVGNEVFPGHTGLWITYVIVVCIAKLVYSVWEAVK